jgi:hypothetical protein
MTTKLDLKEWIVGLKAHGGCAHPIDVAKYVWVNYQDELQGAGDLFYTWQHEVLWAVDDLRREGRMLPNQRATKVPGDLPEVVRP